MSEITMRGVFLKYYPNAIKDRGMDLNKNGKIKGNEKLLDADKDRVLGSKIDFWDFLERNVGCLNVDLKKDVINLYKEKLSDPDNEVRYRAIEGLVELNDLMQLNSKEAIPEIVERVKDSKSYVREAAIEALASLNVKEAIPDIVNGLKDPDWCVRNAAIEALIKFNDKEAISKIPESQMDEVKVFGRVKNVIMNLFGVDEEDVFRDASFINDLSADDLDIVELFMALEEEFGIEVPEKDNLKTVGDAVNYILSNLKK